MGSLSRILLLGGFSSALTLACGGTPDLVQPAGTGGTAATGGGAGNGGTSASGGSSGSGTGGGVVFAGNGGSAGKGGGPGDPCDALECGDGQRCEVDEQDMAACVDNTCDELECDDGEDCVPAAGGGNVCVPHVCDHDQEDCPCRSDVECPASKYCGADDTCVADECEPGARRCDGDEVFICASNGGGETSPYTCSSLGADRFQSECTSANGAGCTCEDDWDCPPDTVCEVGACVGTGVAPTCTLEPVAFEDVPPALEFHWGGASTALTGTVFDPNSPNDDALGKAFPWSAQVLSTPMVVNLDDDNGDGRVNELDFPEIVFLSYHEQQAPGMENAIVRAIHGGGPNKGEDFFALCGNPAPPATPAAAYADENGAYWSEGAPTADRHGALPPVACPDMTCPDGLTCRKGTCVPAPLLGCTSESGAENRSVALGRPAGAVAVGDLDFDGFPEIVVPTEDDSGVQVLSNRGEVIFTARDLFPDSGTTWGYMAPAIANLDFQTDCRRPAEPADERPPCLAEIVVGNRVVVLRKNAMSGALEYDRHLAGMGAEGNQTFAGMAGVTGPTVCLADVRPDVPGLELVAGTSLYQFDPAQPALVNLWNATPEPAYADGFCAVADVWGADTTGSIPPGPDNPLDGVPEVVVVSNGTLQILNSADGSVILGAALNDGLITGADNGGQDGGAPNIDDFDGDGYPEIATALENFYTVIDLQAPEATNCPAWPDLLPQNGAPPATNPARDPGGRCDEDSDCNAGAVCNATTGRCVCLHNGWYRDTEDNSSRATASSVFDFNGDGAAEVVYNDECYFRVYDGASGAIYLAAPSLSRTIIENPVVADVDNDGNAEIVLVNNNEEHQCSETALDSWPDGMNDVTRSSLPNGITVYGDPTDTWVAARRIWNQHSYHVTNVLESGGLPLHEPEHWKPLNGRVYNSYRSQPRVYGVAPNLVLSAIQVSSPTAACGELEDEIEVTVLVRNDGDLRVGPGVEIAFYGTWTGREEELLDGSGAPIVVTLDVSLEPGASTLVTITYAVGNNPAPNDDRLPSVVRAEVDGDDAQRECDESDNEVEGPVDPGEERPDLALEVERGACSGAIDVTLTNEGSDEATDILIRVYAGDPSAGGRLLGETTVDGPLAPGESEEVTIEAEAIEETVTIWGVADPRDTIEECNDANNIDEGPTLECGVVR